MLPDDKTSADMASHNEQIIYDPEYWEELAQQKRAHALALQSQSVFSMILLKHADDYDRLARHAFRMRQNRRTILGLNPQNHNRSDRVVSLAAKTGS